jgi:hypothetical protein
MSIILKGPAYSSSSRAGDILKPRARKRMGDIVPHSARMGKDADLAALLERIVCAQM